METDDTFEGRALGGPAASPGYGIASIFLFGGPGLSLAPVKVGVARLCSKPFST